MATYQELADIAEDPGFGTIQDKVRVACVIKAVALLDLATPTAKQVEWANSTLQSPAEASRSIMFYVLGANSSATIAQILAATDAAVQTNVDAAVDSIVSV